MTPGEKSIWAAVFANEINGWRSSKTLYSYEEWHEALSSAAEVASGVLHYLNHSKDEIVDGFGEDSDVAKHVRAMLEDEAT